MEDMQTRGLRAIGQHLLRRWPELVIEMLSILVALTLAFALDQWREERQHQDQAETLRDAVIGELRSNAEELRSSQAAFNQNFELLKRAGQNGGDNSLRVEMELALLSDAAFQLMQSSLDAAWLDIHWRLDIARIYELQTLVS